MNYNIWRNNLTTFIENANFRAVTIMMTINNLCLFSITDFFDDMMELKSKYGHHRPNISLNMLRWPSFMSPLQFPDEIKKELHSKLKVWYDKNKNSKLFLEGEMNQIQRLLDYIEVVEKGHITTTDDKTLLFSDFKSFFTQYDKRRGKNLLETFPQLTDWYNQIEIQKSAEVKLIIGGGISNYEIGEYK